MFRSNRRPNRRLRVEGLEDRRLLAAYINEIHYDPLFGDASTDQFVELRGEPNATVPAGTYFLGIESADGVDELGDVHTIIDLSGKQFGQNGLMVFVQAGNGFTISSDATTFVGADGFLGVPGFSADDASNSIHAGSSTYLIVQSDVQPSLNMDIDGDDDGLPDGGALGWELLDGVSVFPWVENVWPQHAYAPILFTEDDVGNSHPAVTRVVTEQLAYVGRIGASEGYDAEQWVAGNTVETDRPNNSFEFQLQHGVFGTVVPPAYSSRILDHVGQPNWYTTVSGSVFQDSNLNAVQDAGEVGLADVDVFLDSDGLFGGSFHRESIIADDYDEGDIVNNISSNVTLTTAGDSNQHHGFDITIDDKVFTEPERGQQFAHSGVGFFSENRRLRMDFYRPAREVSANFIGNSTLTDVYGRLEIYNAEGQSLGFLRTQALRADQEQTLTIGSAAGDIAFAVAYSNDSYRDSSPFGRIDAIAFELPQQTTTTNADGGYAFDRVPSGSHFVSITPPDGYRVQTPVSGRHEFNTTDEVQLTDKHFALAGGEPPRFEDTTLTPSEAHDIGTSIGGLNLELGYPHQKLTAEFLSGNEDGLFEFDFTNRRLILTGAGLDYETATSHQLVMKLVDTTDSELFAEATVTVNVADANDAPVVDFFSASIAENPGTGAVVGTVTASDEDAGENGEFDFSFATGNEAGAFAIDAQTGVITVADPRPIDFESMPSFVLALRATDRRDSSVFGQRSITINLEDVNEAPSIPEQTVRSSEALEAGATVGFVTHSDPDAGQSLSWEILQPAEPAFTIHPGGELRLLPGTSLNFEETQSYEMVIRVSDSGEPALQAEQTVTLQVVDANDPPKIENQTFGVSEATASGEVVAKVAASDEDADQQISFEWVSGPDSLFELSSDGEISLEEDAKLDYELLDSYQVVVRAVDSFSPPATAEATLTIRVDDANDAPELVDAAIDANENGIAGTVVATIVANDQDAGDSHTFSIVSQSEDWFVFGENGQLLVRDGADINFEASSSAQVVVEVQDAQGAADQHTFTVTVQDLNDAPQVANAIADQEAEVGEEFVYTIPSGTFIDEDEGDSLQFRAVDGDGFSLPTWISFDVETLTLSGTPSASDSGELQVRISAFDDDLAFASDTFSINIIDNQFPWHNAGSALDANGDTAVTPIDALVIINYINAGNVSQVPNNTPPEQGWLDINADNFVTASDVLIVINHLNAEAEGEGLSNRDAYFGDLSQPSDVDEEEAILQLILDNYRLNS